MRIGKEVIVLNRCFINEDKTFIIKPIRVTYSRPDDEFTGFEYKVVWSASKSNEQYTKYLMLESLCK